MENNEQNQSAKKAGNLQGILNQKTSTLKRKIESCKQCNATF